MFIHPCETSERLIFQYSGFLKCSCLSGEQNESDGS